MGIPLVGKKHQRKASTSQAADWKFYAVPNRICGASGSGCSSANHQQSVQPQQSSSDKREYFVGTLLSRGIASQGDVHARCVHPVCEELDSPTVGQNAVGRNKNHRGGTLATSGGSGGWNQSQAQMRDVSFVFTCCSLGVLWSQSDLIGNSSRKWREERSKYWRSCQCETSRSTPVLVIRASETGPDETGFSGPVARIFGWGVGDSSRRTRCPALVGLQLQQHVPQRSTLLLLAQRRASQGDKDRGFGQGIADASSAEGCVAGMEVAERLQRTRGFRFPFSSLQREETVGSGCRSQAENPTRFCRDRHPWRRLAHVSSHGRDDAGRDGGTSTHDPRLLASHQSSCDEQVSSSNAGEKTPRASKVGRCHLAGRRPFGEQANSDSVVGC